MIGCVFPLLADKTAIKDELAFKGYTEKRALSHSSRFRAINSISIRLQDSRNRNFSSWKTIPAKRLQDALIHNYGTQY